MMNMERLHSLKSPFCNIYKEIGEILKTLIHDQLIEYKMSVSLEAFFFSTLF